MSSFKELIDKWSTVGIRFPFAFDNENQKGSATLLFYYIFSIFTIVSLILLHFDMKFTVATTITVMVWLLSYICYRVRKVDKFKVDLENKSLEVNAQDSTDV